MSTLTRQDVIDFKRTQERYEAKNYHICYNFNEPEPSRMSKIGVYIQRLRKLISWNK